jgi:hypothetical protein
LGGGLKEAQNNVISYSNHENANNTISGLGGRVAGVAIELVGPPVVTLVIKGG